MLNVLHDELLALSEFERRQGIRFADDGDDVNARREAAHQLDVQFPETVACKIYILSCCSLMMRRM